MKRIYVIAGEASGDLHGANLIQHLKTRAAVPLQLYGIGGDRIRATGVHGFYDLAHFHVTGLSEALRKLPDYQRASRLILEKLKNIRPELVVLIDNPGFNLHLAEKLHGMGIPCVYYITPQIWAWAPGRIHKIKRFFKKVLVVFDFERELFERAGVPVRFVGHPLVDIVAKAGHPRGVKEKLGLGADGKLVLLMPGSRRGELAHLLPVLIGAAERIADRLPESYFALLKAPTLPESLYRQYLSRSSVRIELVEDHPYEQMRAADLALVCSGTATLELALVGTPMVITNRSSLLTYLAARSVIRVPYLGLPNLLLQRPAVPELLQYDATPEKIAERALRLLKDGPDRQRMKNDLEEVARHVGGPGAAGRAAEEILAVLETVREQASTFQVRSS